MWRSSVYIPFFISIIAFFQLTFVIQSYDDRELVTIILSIATFLFAIMYGFLLANRYERLGHLRTNLLEDDGRVVNIYRQSIVFGSKVQKKFQKLLDEYLILQLDYRLEDWSKNTYKLFEIQDYVLSIKPRGEVQKQVWNQILSHIENVVVSDRFILHVMKSRLAGYEWGSLIILASIVCSSLLMLPHETLWLKFIIAMLAATLVLLLLVLARLNSLRWGRRNWAWIPLIRLFNEIGTRPYFGEPLIVSGTVDKKLLVSLDTYRVGIFPNEYPDLSGKKIKVVNNRKVVKS
jgi:hypothetical protein